MTFTINETDGNTVTSTSATPFDSEAPDEAFDGPGGGDMLLWSKEPMTRWEILSAQPLHLLVSNESQYDYMPSGAGILIPTHAPSPTHSERQAEDSVTGRALKDGQQFPGTATIETLDGDVLAGEQSDGSFSLVPRPPMKVLEGKGGEPTEQGTVFAFMPDEKGVIFIQEYTGSTTFEFEYDAVDFRVKDANGNPIPDESIGTQAGQRFKTGVDGTVTVNAPTGESMVFSALEGSAQREVEITAGDTIEFKYGGISATAQDPVTGEPYEGVPVKIGQDVYVTDGSGEAQAPKLPLGTYPVVLMGEFEKEVTVSFQGSFETVNFGEDGGDDPLTGLTISVRDDHTGRPVHHTHAEVRGTSIRSESSKSGLINLLLAGLEDMDDVTIDIADKDSRYRTARLDFDADPEELSGEYVEIGLRPTTLTVNS